jgi:ABC transport system ATP-binding/permease protein
MAQIDASDYQGLMDAQKDVDAAEAELDELETEWIELSDKLGID